MSVEDVVEPSRDFLRARSAWGTYARLIVAAVGFPLAYFANPHRPLLHACIAVYLCLAIVAVVVHRSGKVPDLRLALSLVVDTFTVTVLVWAFGSTATVFPVFYALLVCAYTVRGGSRLGLASFVASMAGYSLVLILEAAGVIGTAPLGYPGVHEYMAAIDGRVGFVLLLVVLVACFLFLHATVGRLRWHADTARALWTAERTARARSEELQKKLDEAARLESLGRLTGGIAHDFNNMLTSIMGYTRFAQDGMAANDPGRDDLDAVVAVSERAAVLTAQLLAFSRSQIVNASRVDINELVERSSKTLGRLIGEDVRLEVALTDEPTIVVADPSQIEQVLLVLAVNSRDAMPDGGTLRTSTEVVSIDTAASAGRVDTPPGIYVRIVVTDTGSGIAAEHLPRVFDPFFTTKETGKGSGMGLAAAYGWVKQNDGAIDVESTAAGTTFSILLPTAINPEAGIGRMTPIPGTGRTILVVEDDSDVRRLACRMLLRDGYEVLEAADGRRALAVAERHDGPIDLLLTDVIMPELTGKALAEQLRATRPEIAVVYMSGYTDDIMARHGLLEKRVAIVAKPFDSSNLLDSVRRGLRREK